MYIFLNCKADGWKFHEREGSVTKCIYCGNLSFEKTSPSDPDSCITYNLIKIACCIDTFKNKEQRKFTGEKMQTKVKE